MHNNRAVTLSSILNWEGSDINLAPTEPGGASKYGISVDFLTDYHAKHKLPPATKASVAALTATDANNIYEEMLLDPLQFDLLPSGVDFRLADITTNLGMTGGPNLLQLCLGMYPLSGTVDAKTLAALTVADPKRIIWALSAAWIAVKHTSPNWGPTSVTHGGYGKGWSNRNNAQLAAAMALIR